MVTFPRKSSRPILGEGHRASQRVSQGRSEVSWNGTGTATLSGLQTPIPRYRHPHSVPTEHAQSVVVMGTAGPGLAIRVVCQMEAYVREDFATTNTVLYHLVTLGHRLVPPLTSNIVWLNFTQSSNWWVLSSFSQHSIMALHCVCVCVCVCVGRR